MFGLSAWFLWTGKLSEASISLSAASLLLIFSSLARFKKFKGWGLEAELWEEKLEEAEKLIARIKATSMSATMPLVTLMSHAGYMFQEVTRSQLYTWRKDLEKNLQTNGVGQKEIDEIMEPLHNRHAWEIAAPIYERIIALMQKAVKNAQDELRHRQKAGEDSAAMSEQMLKLDQQLEAEKTQMLKIFRPPVEGKHDLLINALENSRILTSEQKANVKTHCIQRFQDLIYYEKHLEPRHLDSWIKENLEQMRKEARVIG